MAQVLLLVAGLAVVLGLLAYLSLAAGAPCSLVQLRAAPRAAVPQPTPKPEVYALKHPKSWLFSRRRGGGRPLASAAASPRVRFARYRPRVLRGGLRDQRC